MEIQMTISPIGQVEVHVEGVEGPICEQKLAELELERLGKITEQGLKPEYYRERRRQNIGSMSR